MKIDINNDTELMLNWTCIQVSERKWRQDQSRVYTTVNWTPAGKVRVDLMTDRDVPVVAFEGTAPAVYKALVDFLSSIGAVLSMEHSMYIGYELGRCELMKQDYVQG